MLCHIETHTNGKGLWTDEQRLVIINKIGIGFSSLTNYPEDPFYGLIRAYFEPHGFTTGSWNVDGHGLICSDRLWIKEFKAGLRAAGFSIKAAQNVSYAEKDMQGLDYVSMNAGPKFYASWKRLNKLPKEAK